MAKGVSIWSALSGNKVLAVAAVLLVGLLGFSVISEKIPPIPPNSEYGGRVRVIDYSNPKYAAVDEATLVAAIVSDTWFQSKPDTTIAVGIKPMGNVVCTPSGLPGAPNLVFPMDLGEVTLQPSSKKIWTSGEVNIQTYAEQWLSRTVYTSFNCVQPFQLTFAGIGSEDVNVTFGFSMRADDIVCSDTDVLNYWSQGIVTVRSEGVEVASKTDYCADATALEEMECQGINYAEVRHSCLLGCNTGACVQYACSDPDYWDDEGMHVPSSTEESMDIGSTLSRTQKSDYCLSTTALREYVCGTDNRVGYKDFTCGAGCVNGACSLGSCVDSDGGNHEFSYGTLALRLNDGGTDSKADYCFSSTKVVEYFCLGPNTGDYDNSYITCPCGCQDGKCNTVGSTACLQWGSGSSCPHLPASQSISSCTSSVTTGCLTTGSTGLPKPGSEGCLPGTCIYTAQAMCACNPGRPYCVCGGVVGGGTNTMYTCEPSGSGWVETQH